MREIPKTNYLQTINSPADLKKLKPADLKDLAVEIRKELIDVVSVNGGHLAPNLGIVELTIALHYVFNTPSDKLVWDVGHQGYVHKLLTGRREFFKTLRRKDGCLGFLSREESEYDTFAAGHAGTAISAALGMAAARDRLGSQEKVIAIVGDGSLNCGISLEGLNNVAETTRDMIIILNDNKMSISPNVGAIPRYLNHLISGKSYNRFKALGKMLLKRVPGGAEIHKKISKLEEATKSLFVPGVFFEELGLRYIGPIPGHDINELIQTLNGIKEFTRPVIVHVITEKGRGYSHAEKSPESYHGLPSFDPRTGKVNGAPDAYTFSKAFGDASLKLAEQHSNTVFITAAMAAGTGLSELANKYPVQFFDVGIAEEHALVFAAGLASCGMKPVVAIYSTFLQRALDNIFHDICLQNLPVIICADRSGIVDDGPTHHGIHDLGFMRNMPNLTILSPKDGAELENMLFEAYAYQAPVLIRYPKAMALPELPSSREKIIFGKAEVLKDGNDIAFWASGKESYTALDVAAALEKLNIKAAVINSRFLAPFDNELLKKYASLMPIATIEDSQIQGGLGSIVDEVLINLKHNGVLHFGFGLDIVPHGKIPALRDSLGLSVEKITEQTVAFLKEKI